LVRKNPSVSDTSLWHRDCFSQGVKLFRTFLPLFLFAGTALQVQAQSVPLPEGATAEATAAPLTLDDALAMARANNPRLREAEAMTEQASAAIKTARAYANPNIEIYEGRQYARPIATPGVPGLLQHYAAYQQIEIPRERAARRRTAELITESSRIGQHGTLLSVEADTRHAFYNALKRREEISHAGENLKLVEDLHRRVTVEVEVGEKGRLEETRATAEQARAQFEVRSATLQYAEAIAQLRAILGIPAEMKLNPQGELEPRETLPSLVDLRKIVLAAHPALRQAAKQREAASAKLESERAARIPRPTAFAEFENQPDLRYWRAGVSVPLPLFDRRRGEIDAAKAQISRDDAVLLQRTLEITSALERAYEQYQLADQQATSLESGPLHAAESAVEAAQAAYRFGERGIMEVLDTQRVLQDVRGDLLDAQFERQSALVDLEELGAVHATSEARP
jgi:cobalt-zinc-cadmium efflux system outer membrane protein